MMGARRMAATSVGVAVCLAAAGCQMAFHSPPSVVLAGNNYKMLKPNIVGTSRGLTLIGLLHVWEPTRVAALSKVHRDARLEPGRPQTLCNVVVDRTMTDLVLFQIPAVTVRADAIEFTGPPPQKILYPKGLDGPGQTMPYIVHSFPQEIEAGKDTKAQEPKKPK